MFNVLGEWDSLSLPSRCIPSGWLGFSAAVCLSGGMLEGLAGTTSTGDDGGDAL